MIPGPNGQRIKVQLLIWWILWAGVLGGLGVIYFTLSRGGPRPVTVLADLWINLAGFLPLFVSVVIRWLVLPRYTEPGRALVIFIVGLLLAEACGLLGIFLGGPYRDALFALGVLGIVQFVPPFAKRLFEPRGGGFFPNR